MGMLDSNATRAGNRWSEMKIVRTLNEQPHDSIISFQSFIITPSFAMIAMCVSRNYPLTAGTLT